MIYLYSMVLKSEQENLSKLNFPKEQQNSLLHQTDTKIDDDQQRIAKKEEGEGGKLNTLEMDRKERLENILVQKVK